MDLEPIEDAAEYFRAQGFYVEYPSRQGALIVAAQPTQGHPITVYQRSVQIWHEGESQWRISAQCIKVIESMTLEQLKVYVRTLMRSTDQQWDAELDRRRAFMN